MTQPKTIIITGCNGGIGAIMTRELIAHGYHVIGLDQGTCSAPQLLDSGSFDFIACDLFELVNDPAVQDQFNKDLSKLASFTFLFGLVNNAAVQIVSPAKDMALEDFRKTLDVNVAAAFELSRICYDKLAENQGSIVNISSIHARLSKKQFVAYATSKAALSALTRYLALDWGGTVRVNAIEPAAIETEMLKAGFGTDWPQAKDQIDACHPSQKIGQPEEVAEATRFLLEGQGFLTGTIVDISGAISGVLNDPNAL